VGWMDEGKRMRIDTPYNFHPYNQKNYTSSIG
jgi:hypothetical protein